MKSIKGAGRAAADFRLGYVLPELFVFGALLNLALTTPTWNFNGFTQVSLHASRGANYLADPLSLNFAPVDPRIVDDAKANQSNAGTDSSGVAPQSTPDPNLQGTAQATSNPNSTTTSTSDPTNPTLPSVPTDILLPTSPLPEPTIEIPDIEDVIESVVPAVENLIETVVTEIPLISDP